MLKVFLAATVGGKLHLQFSLCIFTDVEILCVLMRFILFTERFVTTLDLTTST